MYQTPYNYNMRQTPRNMYQKNNRNGDRFFGGGFVVPFLLGGIAGNLWNNNNQWNPYPYPYPVPYPVYYNNNPWNNSYYY